MLSARRGPAGRRVRGRRARAHGRGHCSASSQVRTVDGPRSLACRSGLLCSTCRVRRLREAGPRAGTASSARGSAPKIRKLYDGKLMSVPNAVVDRLADLRQARGVDPGQHQRADDDAPDVAHAAEHDHREQDDRDGEVEPVGEDAVDRGWRRRRRRARRRTRRPRRPRAWSASAARPSCSAASSSSRIASQARPSRPSRIRSDTKMQNAATTQKIRNLVRPGRTGPSGSGTIPGRTGRTGDRVDRRDALGAVGEVEAVMSSPLWKICGMISPNPSVTSAR